MRAQTSNGTPRTYDIKCLETASGQSKSGADGFGTSNESVAYIVLNGCVPRQGEDG